MSFSSQSGRWSAEHNNNRQHVPSIKVHNALKHGCMEYSKSWAWQHVLLSQRLARRRRRNNHLQNNHSLSVNESDNDNIDDSDCVLLLEHSPVYTLGRGADECHLTFLNEDGNGNYSKECENIRQKLSRNARGPGTARLAVDRSNDSLNNLTMDQAMDQLSKIATPFFAPNQVPIYRVERGGEVTFHGPSQLVVYPLLDLQRPPFKQDLHWYLRMVEEVVIQTLQHYNIESQRDKDNTGVWVEDNKVAAVGISSSRWITTHGFALNVDPDLEYFDTSFILPCGIEGRGVTSMAKILSERGAMVPSMGEVATVVVQTMQDVFGVTLE